METNNPEIIANEVFNDTPEIDNEEQSVISNEEEREKEEREEEGEEESNKEVEEEESNSEEGEEESKEEGENNVKEIIMNQNEKENTLNIAKNNAIQVVNSILENINNGLMNVNALFAKKDKTFNKINGNIQNMISYQDHLYEDEKYLEYLNYLKLFYELDNKKNIYKKSYEDNKLVLTSQDKRIVITPSIVVDLDNYKIYLEKQIHNILFNILNLIENYSMNNQSQKDEFNKYKNSYILFKSQLNDIQNIEKNYFEKIAKYEEDIALLSIELNLLKENRVSIYSQIKTKINNEIKEKLIISFKDANNKIPPTEIIKELSTNTQVPIEDIELWLQWIEKSYLYLNSEQKYSQYVKEKYIEEENFKNLTKNFILQKPNVEFS